MKKVNLMIVDSIGLHVDPAYISARVAERYESNILIEHAGKIADMKSLLSIVSLTVKKGETIKIHIDGLDEDVALKDIVKTLKENQIALIC